MKDCDWARERFALLLYGELGFDDEERVESHLDRCAECRAALEREKALHAALDAVEISPSPSLARECREDLRARLLEEAAPARAGWWERLVDAIALRPSAGMLRPAGALTLVALGFFAARAVPYVAPYANLGGQFNSAALSGRERVRYVEPASDGRVEIYVDETRQRVISGRLDDAPIRGLLLAAAKDPDPGLRAETVGILNARAQSADVRGALIFAVEHDQNAGVREKAMHGLTPYATEPEVRNAFTYVLLSDSNPGLRTKAIDLLTRGSELDPQVIGTLQELMVRGERLGYVRQRCLRVLQAVNASAETY